MVQTAALDTLRGEIVEYQTYIIKCARELSAMADAGAKWDIIDAQIGFMDTLQAHRRGVLSEYSRAGGRVKDLYGFGACIEEDTNAPIEP